MADRPRIEFEGAPASEAVRLERLKTWFVEEVLPLESVLVQFLSRGGRGKAEVEDLRQELYTKVCAAAREGFPHPARPFVFTMARNLLIDRLRHEQVVPFDTVENLEDLNIAIDEPAPDRVVIARQELRRIQLALDKLPERLRNALVMRKVEGLSIREIAQRTGLAEKTVEKHLTEAMRALAHILYRENLGEAGMSGVPEMYMSADEIDARASEFILRQHDVGGWNESDQQSLNAWLNESLSHRTSYWRLEAAWLRADRLDALRRLPPDTGEAVSNTRRRFGFIVAAAVLLAALAGAAAFNYPWRGTDVAYATTVGGHRTIMLVDGSRVELNTDTDLRIETDATHRTVRLVKGEAFFQIRHDAARPFVVLANGHRVTDLGTEFLVRENGDGVKVAVVQGRARLEYTDESKEHQAIVLSPGEEAVSTRNALSVTKKTVTESESELGWRHGMLMFHHTALPDVAAEYNRYNRTKIVIADPQVASLTISASLPTTDVGAFARMAQNFLGLHVEKEGDEVLISR